MDDQTLTETKKSRLEVIHEKFKRLKEEATADCKFDKTKMVEQFNNTSLIMKWINYKTEFSEVYRVYEQKRKEQYRKLYNFYKLESDLKINTSAELQLFIESDLQYTEIFSICQVLKEMIEYISCVVENLKGKGYEIQRYQMYLNFMNGK